MRRELDSLVVQMLASGVSYDSAVREFKRSFILEVLYANRGNQCKAARALGMHRNTLSRTITELQIDPSQIKLGRKRPAASVRPDSELRMPTRIVR